MRYLPLIVAIAAAIPALAGGPTEDGLGVTVGCAPEIRRASVADPDLVPLDPQQHELGDRLLTIAVVGGTIVPGVGPVDATGPVNAAPVAAFPFRAIPVGDSVCLYGVCPVACGPLDFACRAGAAPKSGQPNRVPARPFRAPAR